ncbi:pyrroloquinoline quinone biosynthesis protein PqqD [Salinisphaera sp. C84B14]|uniref:pyrroloquinoline quinone biosynthesis peptide chaperone PqqD n=1 Tax=Salinisphaera sp. C84B14 TaxID=1304155 RepID=UPI00333EF373
MSADRPISDSAVPQITRGHRLQFEPAQDCHVLLYPEGMITLNDSAAEILQRCDGQRSVQAICTDLSAAFDGAEVTADVHDFLKLAASHGWVILA